MTDRMRVVLEIGPTGRRVVAGAIDWPGLDRWGKDEDAALAKLAAYVPRYAGVASAPASPTSSRARRPPR